MRTRAREGCRYYAVPYLVGGNQPGALPLANRPENITRRLWTSQTQVLWDLLPRPWPTVVHPSLSLPSFPRRVATLIIPCNESTVQELGFLPSSRRYQKSRILSLEHQFEGSAYEHRKASVP